MHILIADNRPKVRFALRVLLERQPKIESVQEAVHAEDLLSRMEEACPDLVLIGWELPGLASVGSLSALRSVCPGASLIVLSGRPEARQAALSAGADAFVSKTDLPERLLATIAECCAQGCPQRVTKIKYRRYADGHWVS
jgi:two-component system invasion response regulator UvrY